MESRTKKPVEKSPTARTLLAAAEKDTVKKPAPRHKAPGVYKDAGT